MCSKTYLYLQLGSLVCLVGEIPPTMHEIPVRMPNSIQRITFTSASHFIR